jgi:hypothetical protein
MQPNTRNFSNAVDAIYNSKLFEWYSFLQPCGSPNRHPKKKQTHVPIFLPILPSFHFAYSIQFYRTNSCNHMCLSLPSKRKEKLDVYSTLEIRKNCFHYSFRDENEISWNVLSKNQKRLKNNKHTYFILFATI